MAEVPTATVPDGYTALSVVGLVNKGTHDSSKSYKKYDFVYEANTHSSYVALMDVDANGTTPLSEDTSHWQLLAQGVVGAAAGFGEITAKIEDNSLEGVSVMDATAPSVKVETSGDNTKKNITFTFSNLKGDKGDQGDPGQNGEKGEQGNPGTPGVKGDIGPQGVSVTKLTVGSDNHLKYTLSATAPTATDTESDAGEIHMDNYIPTSQRGTANGVASLDQNSKILETQMPCIKEILNDKLKPENWKDDTTEGNNGYPRYTYDITIDGLTENHLVFVHAPMKLTIAQINAFAYAGITARSQEANKITLQAINKPTIELPVVIEISAETVQTVTSLTDSGGDS